MNSNVLKLSFTSVLLLSLVSGCLKNDELNQPYINYIPVNIQDGLILSNPTNENMNPNTLHKIYQDVYIDETMWSLKSLLVFRNGKLVSEAYLKSDKDITSKQLMWSCTKQFMGALTGIALEEGVIKDLDDPISDYFVEELTNHQDKKDITIRNLITMQSGIDYNNDGVGGQTDKLLRQIPDDMVDFILDRPIKSPQGTAFHYNDGDPHLMAALIQKKVGQPTDEWADEMLFSKINLTNYNWVHYKDGSTYGGYGLEMTPREMGKFALCVGDSGNYKGDQVIPKSWITEMVAPQVFLEDADFDFGFYWWIDPVRNIHFTWGHGGQFAFIVPDKNIVVVMTSIPNTQGNYQIDANEALLYVDRIINASF